MEKEPKRSAPQSGIFKDPENILLARKVSAQTIIDSCKFYADPAVLSADAVNGFLPELKSPADFEAYCDNLMVTTLIVPNAPIFEFPTLNPGQEHYAFACELVRRGDFRLPFDNIIIRLEGDTRSYFGWIVLSQDLSKNLIQGMAFSFAGKEDGGRVLPRAMFDVHLGTESPENIAIRVAYATYSNIGRDLIVALVGAGFGHLVSLMSEGVEVESIIPSAKLNKARIKRGKLPLNPRYKVKINLAKASRIKHDDGEIDLTSHTHASPSPHWRRGHYRTLISKLGERREVPVIPTYVGGTGENVPELGKRLYEVIKDVAKSRSK